MSLASTCAAQSAPGGALPLSDPPAARTRADLLELLDDVQNQIEALPAQPQQADQERLGALKSQLELLLLQAQLEKLQRENATLKKQLAATPQEPSGAAAELSTLEARMGRVTAQQENLTAQMQVIADQHAAILGAAEPAEAYDESAEAQGEESQAHTVVEGDSLSRLAQTYLGNGALWPEILALNPDISDSNQLLIGTELTLPPRP